MQGILVPSILERRRRDALQAPAPVAPPADASLDGVAAAAAAGDTEAVAQLYDALVGPVYRYVALRLQRREDAEDVTQLVFERIVAALPRYRATGRPFQAWAFRIARNAVIDHLRRARSHETLGLAPERDQADGPDEVSLRGEEVRELRMAIARLTAEQQEAVVLRYALGLSADEAALIMGRRPGTVRGLTFRAIASLRRHLAEPQHAPATAATRRRGAGRSAP